MTNPGIAIRPCHDSSARLEECVPRICSRKSVTAMPIPRIAHLIGNVLVDAASDDSIDLIPTAIDFYNL